jgi:hypothetical protein
MFAANPPAGSNYGAAPTINVGGPNGSWALVQFDLTALPAGTTAANIARATLTLFVNKIGAAGTIDISVANGAWTEAGVNGNKAPAAAAAIASAASVSTGGAYLYIDATAAVKNWLTAVSNSGFIITPNDAAIEYGWDSGRVAFDPWRPRNTETRAPVKFGCGRAPSADASRMSETIPGFVGN